MTGDTLPAVWRAAEPFVFRWGQGSYADQRKAWRARVAQARRDIADERL